MRVSRSGRGGVGCAGAKGNTHTSLRVLLVPPLLTVIPTPGLVGSEAGFGASFAVQLPSTAQGALTVSPPAATLILAPPLLQVCVVCVCVLPIASD